MREDRSMIVPPGSIVKTAYVSISAIELACKERMAVGDVDRAYQKRLQMAPDQPWPPPLGHWGTPHSFVIEDGRHEYVAALMLGCSHLLVAWMEKPE